jgi:uncharacterized protein (TIGR02246 family)
MKASPLIFLGTLLAAGLGGSGQSPNSEAALAIPADDPIRKPEDEKAIRSLTDAFVEAFGKGDAKAIAAMFTEQGEAIDSDGAAIRGRASLEAHYAGRFANFPGEKIETKIDLIHFLTPEVARQDGRSKLIPVGEDLATTSKYTATFVKSQGRWLVASIRELEDNSTSHHDRLKELEWLIGEWVEETGDAVISTKIAWSDDENYLLRSYEIRVDGKHHLKGTQRIGWDPLTKQFKSWVFDSQGGYGEGFWNRNGDQWSIKSSGVQSDGRTTSATQVLTRLSKDRLHWKSTDRTLGGETREDVAEYTMVRKPPEPK